MHAHVDGKVLRIKDCRDPIKAMRGLMFSSLCKEDGALIKGNSIWMPFCKPLVLVFLDKNYKIMKTDDAVPLTLNPRSWHIYSCKDAKYCLEINALLVEKKRIKSVEIED